MKTLFEKPATIVKYALTIMVFALLLGTIFVVGFGFNASSEYGGVYELTVDCFDENKIEEYTDECKAVLDDYGYSAKDVIIEQRSVCDTIVVRYASGSETNAQKIEADVTTKLGLNENLVSVSALSAPSAIASSLKLLIAVGVIAVGVFAYTMIRMGWKKALAVLLNLVLSAFVPLAVFAISRIEMSYVGFGVALLFACLSTVLFVAVLSKLDAIKKQQEKEETFLDNYLNLLNANKFKAIIPSLLILLVLVCLMFTFTRNLVFVGLVGLVSALISAFNFIIFSPNFLLLLDTPRQKKVSSKK